MLKLTCTYYVRKNKQNYSSANLQVFFILLLRSRLSKLHEVSTKLDHIYLFDIERVFIMLSCTQLSQVNNILKKYHKVKVKP